VCSDFRKNGFYNPELNAFSIYGAGAGQNNGLIWVCRYKGAR
jgi:hypothetical protein